MIIRRLFICLGLASVLIGCGRSGVNRESVSGSVSFSGQPVVYGTIEFRPDKAKGHSGPACYAEILDGKFQTNDKVEGVFPGPHLVRITAFKERPPAPAAQAAEDVAGPPGPVPIFQNYEIETVLAGNQQHFEIPDSARGFGLKRGRM